MPSEEDHITVTTAGTEGRTNMNPLGYNHIEEIMEANAKAGGYFFDAATMRCFKSRVLDGVYGGRYFITSEQHPHGPRGYTIRECTPEGDCRTAKGCRSREFPTSAKARMEALRMAQNAQ